MQNVIEWIPSLNMGIGSCVKGKFMDNLGGSLNLNHARFYPEAHGSSASSKLRHAVKYEYPLGTVVYFLEECIWAVECAHARVLVNVEAINQPVYNALIDAHDLEHPPQEANLQELPLPLLHSLLHPHTTLLRTSPTFPSGTSVASASLSPAPMPPLFAGFASYSHYTSLAARGWRVHRAQRFSFPALAAHDTTDNCVCAGNLPDGLASLSLPQRVEHTTARDGAILAAEAEPSSVEGPLAIPQNPTDPGEERISPSSPLVVPLPPLCVQTLVPQPRGACVPRACVLAGACPILSLAQQTLTALGHCSPASPNHCHTPESGRASAPLYVNTTAPAHFTVYSGDVALAPSLPIYNALDASNMCPCVRSRAIAAVLEALAIDAFALWPPTTSFAPSRAPLPAALLLVPGKLPVTPIPVDITGGGAAYVPRPLSDASRAALLRTLGVLVGVRLVWAGRDKETLLVAVDAAHVWR